jgi:hypothetical protein
MYRKKNGTHHGPRSIQKNDEHMKDNRENKLAMSRNKKARDHIK